ncbi:hypothetical protein P5V15_005326 [Pogonomyrmex californicus]
MTFSFLTGCSCVVYSSSDRPQGGTFTSPDFPRRYPSNIDCLLYTFIGHPDEIVVLTFHQFNIRRTWPDHGAKVFFSVNSKLVRLYSPHIKSHGNGNGNGDGNQSEGIGTLFHFRCITPGCGVPDCTTVARRVPLTPARSICQLDCSRNVGCTGTTMFPRPRHRCATLYIPLRQPLSRYPLSLISIPVLRVVPGVWRTEIRRAISRFLPLAGNLNARVH